MFSNRPDINRKWKMFHKIEKILKHKHRALNRALKILKHKHRALNRVN